MGLVVVAAAAAATTTAPATVAASTAATEAECIYVRGLSGWLPLVFSKLFNRRCDHSYKLLFSTTRPVLVCLCVRVSVCAVRHHGRCNDRRYDVDHLYCPRLYADGNSTPVSTLCPLIRFGEINVYALPPIPFLLPFLPPPHPPSLLPIVPPSPSGVQSSWILISACGTATVLLLRCHDDYVKDDDTTRSRNYSVIPVITHDDNNTGDGG